MNIREKIRGNLLNLSRFAHKILTKALLTGSSIVNRVRIFIWSSVSFFKLHLLRIWIRLKITGAAITKLINLLSISVLTSLSFFLCF